MAVRKSLSHIAPFLLTLALSSCAVNLGKFDTGDGYKSYYDSFGEVKGLYDGGQESYDIEESLFNDKTMKEFKWNDDADAVKEKQYLYLVLPFKASLKVETIAFYLKSPTNITAELSLFYFLGESGVPQKIKYLTSPETEPIYDDDGNIIGEEPIEYDDDPTILKGMIAGKLELNANSWVSVGFGGFSQQGYDDSYLHTGKDGLLYIRVDNNSGWNVGKLEPVTFTFINLLVRAVD